MDIPKIRADFPALKNYVWFQNGSVSLTPTPVAEEHLRLLREGQEQGPLHILYPEEEYARRAETLSCLANFWGASSAELALMRGVSEAYTTVLRGLNWQTGDQILTTEEEELAVLLPSLRLRDIAGVEVVKTPLIADAEGQIHAVAERITSRTRLIVVSHVTTDQGFRLPVREICHLARDTSVLTFLDLAHSAGVFPINLHEIGCDFAGLLSYKWMYAPYGSGALFVRKERLNALQIIYGGGRELVSFDFGTDTFTLKDTAERFQYGPWSWAQVHAWAYAARYLTEIGLESIWERTAFLTTRLKAGLGALPGVTLYTPTAPERSASLVSFGVAGWTGKALEHELRQRWNIVIKALYISKNGLRASVPFFLLEDEIDQLLEAVRTLANERVRP